VGSRHRQVDACFVDEKQALGASDHSATQEPRAFSLDLGCVRFGGVESLFLRVSPSSMRRRDSVEMLTRTFSRLAVERREEARGPGREGCALG
jgi:hypothetical protein